MTPYKSYAGIGSRYIPFEIEERIERIAYKMAKLGYTLRSGAALGSDHHFEIGCDFANGQKEIFLPNKGFQDHESSYYVENWTLYLEALRLAEFYYGSGWKFLTDWATNLYTKPKRKYVIFDDTSKKYVSEFSPFVRGVGTSKTESKAHKFDSVDNIIRVLNQIKHTGAWRTIRVS